MQDLREESVGMLVAQQALRAVVFDKHGIDFCCGGKQTLEEACFKTGTNADQLIIELRNCDEIAVKQDDTKNWLRASMTELVNHIVETHHAYLKAELPLLKSLAAKVALVHGIKEPRVVKIAKLFADMADELLTHALKEESTVFPFICQLDRGVGCICDMNSLIENLELEHSATAEAIIKLRELTDDYAIPTGACSSWLVLLNGLEHLDSDLRAHIHKENTILFPRAIKAQYELARQPIKPSPL